MKKIYIIVVILILLISSYLGYKIYYDNYYDLKHINGFEESKENFIINVNLHHNCFYS